LNEQRHHIRQSDDAVSGDRVCCPFVSPPFLLLLGKADGMAEVSWLQIVSAALLAAAVLLAVLEHVSATLRRVCQYRRPTKQCGTGFK
jgi:hypothetical protein